VSKQAASVAPESPAAEVKTVEPNHHFHLNRFSNYVACRIDLRKIPPSCIKFEPTKTHCYLDTLKYSKKYLLNVTYPDNVEVDPNVEAELKDGILTCRLAIVNDPNRPPEYDEKN